MTPARQVLCFDFSCEQLPQRRRRAALINQLLAGPTISQWLVSPEIPQAVVLKRVPTGQVRLDAERQLWSSDDAHGCKTAAVQSEL